MGHNIDKTQYDIKFWMKSMINKKKGPLTKLYKYGFVQQICDNSYNHLDNLSKFAMCQFVT
jgi:hypothetical protein